MKPQNLLTGGNVELYDVALCYGINSYFNDEDKKFNIATVHCMGLFGNLSCPEHRRFRQNLYVILLPFDALIGAILLIEMSAIQFCKNNGAVMPKV